MRNSLIFYTIQQKIYETHKIWHPREKKLLLCSLQFIEIAKFPGSVRKFWKFRRGEGGGVNFEGRFWKIQGGGGVIR